MLQNKVGEQKLYNLFGHFRLFIVISALFTLLSGESFENFKRTGLDISNSYLDEKDRVFSNCLKSGWKAYVAEKNLSLYEKQKPIEISSAKYRKVKKIGPKINIRIKKNDKPNVKIAENFKESEIEKKDIEFDFFGTLLGFNIPSGVKEAKFYPQNQKGINNFFNIIASSDYEILIDYINRTSSELNLNDWGKYILIKGISKKIFSNQNNSRLFSWFVFNKLGYAVRVGLLDKRVVVMYHSNKVIYSTPRYKIDEKNFYVISDYSKNTKDKIFTYKQNYPDSDKVFDLSMNKLPVFNEDLKTKTLSFKQFSKGYTINYRYNQNLIDFMATYPQADCETFFKAPLDTKTYEDIARGLKKYIDLKHASVALNFVLNFVQQAFEYEVDNKQFGREKVMFAQETLYYDKSDSEDRAILFSYIVRELFNINIVGVKYKNHMATALYIPMNGDSVKIYSKKFIVADPTYKNAIIGQSMPKYKRVKPESFIK